MSCRIARATPFLRDRRTLHRHTPGIAKKKIHKQTTQLYPRLDMFNEHNEESRARERGDKGIPQAMREYTGSSDGIVIQLLQLGQNCLEPELVPRSTGTWVALEIEASEAIGKALQ